MRSNSPPLEWSGPGPSSVGRAHPHGRVLHHRVLVCFAFERLFLTGRLTGAHKVLCAVLEKSRVEDVKVSSWDHDYCAQQN